MFAHYCEDSLYKKLKKNRYNYCLDTNGHQMLDHAVRGFNEQLVTVKGRKMKNDNYASGLGKILNLGEKDKVNIFISSVQKDKKKM